MPEQLVLEIFSDYVCPFCYLAEPAVAELIRTHPEVQVTWRAFELRPEPVPLLDPQSDYLTRIWRDTVEPRARELNVTMRMPPVQPRTRLAHEAVKYAAAKGLFAQYHDELFRSFFERGEDIGKTDVLVSLAEHTGLNGGELRAKLAEHRYGEEVQEDLNLAKRMGIEVVPAFVANRQRVITGMQPVEHLRRLLMDF